jgi:hypothetical protein
MNRVVLRERRQPTSFITSPLPDLHYVSTHNDWILIDYGGESITGVENGSTSGYKGYRVDKMARLSQNSSIVTLSSALTVHSADQLDTCACLCSFPQPLPLHMSCCGGVSQDESGNQLIPTQWAR